MIANFCSETVDGGLQPPELRSWFRDLQLELRRDRTENEYRGTLAVCKGLSLTYERFRTHKDALQWLKKNTHPRQGAKAVRVETPPSMWVVGGTCLK